MPEGQIIGRVSVKVLPDTDDFRRLAERKLTEIERTLKFTVGTKLDMTGAQREFLTELRAINQRNRMEDSRKIRFHATFSRDGMDEELAKAIRVLNAKASGRKVKIDADLVAGSVKVDLDKQSLDHVKRQLEDFRRDNSPIKIEVKPDLAFGSGTVVSKRLEYLSRPRRVPMLPYVPTGAATKVATALAALSGARVVSDAFREMVEWLGRLDKSVPLIGSLALAIAGLAAWGMTAASNLFALSASLAQIGPAALSLPGIFGGIAIGLLTTFLALKDFNQVLPEVKTQFTALQQAVSANFWAVAAEPIRALVDTLLPQLSTGMRSVATQIGGFFAGLASGLGGALSGELAGMFTDLSASITIATGATGALASIITVLGQVGAGYLPRLAAWFVDITTSFSTWLATAASDGSLSTWINTALFQLQELGRVIVNATGVFVGLATAASTAGGSSLTMLADTLQRVSDVVNGPAFQGALVGVLAAAHQALTTIATTSGPAVEQLFQTLATTLTTILPTVGTAIGTLLGSVASALANPALQTGIIAMFQGIGAAVQGLAPALAPIGAAFGALGQVIGTMAAMLGPLIATVFGALAQVLSALLPAMQPLISMLGGALTAAFQALSPVIMQVVGAVTSLISGGLMQALQTVIAALAPTVAQLGPLLGQVLVTAVGAIAPILTGLVPLLGQVVGIVGQLFAGILPQLLPLLTLLGTTLGQILVAVTPLVTALLQLVVAVLGPLLTVVINIVSTALPPLLKAIQALVKALLPVIDVLTVVVQWLVQILAPAIEWLGNAIIKSFIDIIDGIARVFRGVVDIVTGVWNTFAGLFTLDWQRMWTGIKDFFSGIWDLIVGAFEIILNLGMLGVVKKGMLLIRGLWEEGWIGLKVLAELVWNGLKSAWEGFLTALKNAPGSALTAIKNLFAEAWSVIKTAASMAWDAIRSTFVDGVANARTVLAKLPGAAEEVLSDLGSTLVNAGRKLIEGFINGITSMFGKVKSTLGDLTSKVTDWKGPPRTDRILLVGAGRLVMDGFIAGLESRYDAVRRSLRDLTADINAMPVDPPTIAGVRAARLGTRLAGTLTDALSGEGHVTKILNYYAAPGASVSAEEDLFTAVGRARMAGW